jgi:hypothetical protein
VGLELLSFGGGAGAPGADAAPPPDPLEPFRRDPARLQFLDPEGFVRVKTSGSTRAERNASSLNSFVARVLDIAPREGMSPWHTLQLGSFLRRSAATGYLPPEEESAYFRLAIRLLSEAEAQLRAHGGDPELLSYVLAEKGLALAETTLTPGGAGAWDGDGDGAKGGKEGARPGAGAGAGAGAGSGPGVGAEGAGPGASPPALAAAAALWDEAEGLVPGASGYARARWAAWSGVRSELARHLPHAARDEDMLLWPTFREAAMEPAFRSVKDEPWFRSLWFGYSR